MTVEELIYELQQFDENLEVRLATQSRYPLQYHINGVASFQDEEEMEDPCEGCGEFEKCQKDNTSCKELDKYENSSGGTDYTDGKEIVYVTEGSQIGYMSHKVWED